MLRRGFTMLELLVAIAILVVMILVTAQVFQSATALTRAGQAAGDVVQEAVSIERQVRHDLDRLSLDGILGIHSVEVPNNYNRSRWNGTGIRPGLINPHLAADAPVRCDQLVFFVEGFERSLGFGSNIGYSDLPGMAPKTIGQSAMLRYGHGLQFPELQKYEARPGMLATGQPQLTAQDIDVEARRDGDGLVTNLTPFHHPQVDSSFGGPLDTVWTRYYLGTSSMGGGSSGSSSALYDQTAAPTIGGAQPEARRWLFTRTAVAMGDDDQQAPNYRGKRAYQNETLSTETLFPFDPRWGISDPDNGGSSAQLGFRPKAPVVDYGRVDVTAMSMADVRSILLMSRHSNGWDNARRPWMNGRDNPDGSHSVLESTVPGNGDQRAFIKSLFGHARAERQAPGNARFDQMLGTSVLGSAVSSFIVEWTWDQEVGAADGVQWPRLVEADVRWHGLRTDPADLPAALDAMIDPLPGMSDSAGDGVDSGLETIWFGLPSMTDGNGISDQWDRRVVTYGQFAVAAPGLPVENPIFANDEYELTAPATAAPSLVWVDPNDNDPGDLDNINPIDEVDVEGSFGNVPRVREYWALFGPNMNQPLLDQDDDNNGLLDPDPSFTPWPTALRFSMTIHDPATNLEGGRHVQFIVPLPKRVGG